MRAYRQGILLNLLRSPMRAYRRLRSGGPFPHIINLNLPPFFGTMRRLKPVSGAFGFERGTPIDRYYIENFLESHASDVCGRVLEVGDARYTKRFGKGVTQSDVLHVVPGLPETTIIGNLETGENIPKSQIDCMILTQVFFAIYDVRQAIKNCWNALAPGGVLLASLPGISQICRYDYDHWGDYWRFTDAAAKRLFGNVFGPENVLVETHGNVYVACAFLHGLAKEDLTKTELDTRDRDYQVNICVRAVKSTDSFHAQG